MFTNSLLILSMFRYSIWLTEWQMAEKCVLITETVYFSFLSRIILSIFSCSVQCSALRLKKFYEIDFEIENDCNGKSIRQIYVLRAKNEVRFGATWMVNIVQQSNALRARYSMCLLNVDGWNTQYKIQDFQIRNQCRFASTISVSSDQLLFYYSILLSFWMAYRNK